MKLFIIFLTLFLMAPSCQSPTYQSDVSFMSPLEAMAPNIDMLVNERPCIDVTGEIGHCSITIREGNNVIFSLKNSQPTEVEYQYISSCGHEGKEIANGNSIIHVDSGSLSFVEEGCVFLFKVSELRQEPKESASSMFGIVNIRIFKKDFLHLAKPYYKKDGRYFKIISSPQTKYLRIRLDKRIHIFEKTYEVKLLASGTHKLYIEAWTEQARYARNF